MNEGNAVHDSATDQAGSERAQSDLMSLVTHELRLPLTSIKGYTDLLRREMAGPLNEQQKQFLDIVQRNVTRMSALIDNLSDINRLQQDRLRLDRRPVELTAAVALMAAEMAEAIAGRQQAITQALPADLPQVLADPTRLHQVLSILLSNAHLYTPEGGAIRIEAIVEGEDVRVIVRDNGVGISAADQDMLFTQFFRSADPAVRAQTGWGLGLFIARQLVALNGGEISCVSALGQGSAFHFTLPVVPGT